MTHKCLKATAFCFCWGFHKASLSQRMQTVLFLGCQNGGHSARQSWGKAWKLGKRIKLCARSSGTTITECCVLLRKLSFSLVWPLSTNSMAWKLARWAKFVLVLMNTQMLKKSRISVNRFQRSLNEATSVVDIYAKLLCEISWFFYLFSLSSILLKWAAHIRTRSPSRSYCQPHMPAAHAPESKLVERLKVWLWSLNAKSLSLLQTFTYRSSKLTWDKWWTFCAWIVSETLSEPKSTYMSKNYVSNVSSDKTTGNIRAKLINQCTCEVKENETLLEDLSDGNRSHGKITETKKLVKVH